MPKRDCLEKCPAKTLKHVLTRKQQVFVTNYLVNYNATEAAMACGVNKKNASATGSNWLNPAKFPQVKAEIDRVLAERRARSEVKVDQVLAEYAKIAFMDYRKLFDADGKVCKGRDLPEEVAGAVSKLRLRRKTGFEDGEPVQYEIADIDFHDKLQALNMLARHLGIGQEKGPKDVHLTQINWTQLLAVQGGAVPPDPATERMKLLELASGTGEPNLTTEFAEVRPGEYHANGNLNRPVSADHIPADFFKGMAGSGNDGTKVITNAEYVKKQQSGQ